GILLAVGQEPVQQTALIHDLDAARMQAQRADQLARLRILLQHQHVHVVEPQLARQHHSGRTAPADDHLRHENPDSATTYFGGQSQIARSRKAARRLRDQATAYHPAAEWGSCGKPPDGRYPGTSKEKNLLAFLMCGPRHFYRALTETGQYSRNLAARPDVSLAISGIAGVMIPFLVTTHRPAGSIRSDCHSILTLSSCYGDGWCRVRDRGDRRWGESGGGA